MFSTTHPSSTATWLSTTAPSSPTSSTQPVPLGTGVFQPRGLVVPALSSLLLRPAVESGSGGRHAPPPPRRRRYRIFGDQRSLRPPSLSRPSLGLICCRPMVAFPTSTLDLVVPRIAGSIQEGMKLLMSSIVRSHPSLLITSLTDTSVSSSSSLQAFRHNTRLYNGYKNPLRMLGASSASCASVGLESHGARTVQGLFLGEVQVRNEGDAEGYGGGFGLDEASKFEYDATTTTQPQQRSTVDDHLGYPLLHDHTQQNFEESRPAPTDSRNIVILRLSLSAFSSSFTSFCRRPRSAHLFQVWAPKDARTMSGPPPSITTCTAHVLLVSTVADHEEGNVIPVIHIKLEHPSPALLTLLQPGFPYPISPYLLFSCMVSGFDVDACPIVVGWFFSDWDV
ncbi:hypothetical protein ONZ45_g9549 [Pleurotus djamor]|nr:hypothetical protein ONZ45_g9549 [Pleurotus djamor]